MSDDAELVKLSGLLRTARRRPEPQEKPGAGETADWGEYVFGQIARAFLPVQLSTEQASNLRTVIATGMAGIAPKDALKEMIAAQMLACHDAAMDCYRLTMKSFEESTSNRNT
jgi:hypothetical protein